MFEKVNPSHPDKVADRIAGAIVDLCYTKSKNPKVACEVLIGHGECNIQVETSELITDIECEDIVRRIAGDGIETRALIVPQDIHLAANQCEGVRCGDNGIFKGAPMTHEQKKLTEIAAEIYGRWTYDGKYIIQGKGRLAAPVFDVTVCQSHTIDEHDRPEITNMLKHQHHINGKIIVNPLGDWTGGPNTDSGATNRKLGSDMGDGVTGGGLHGKDLSKADVSVNIVCHLLAQENDQTVTAICSIGDDSITFNYESGKQLQMTYANVVHRASEYIQSLGGFEKFAEWGLVRP